jgi:N-acetylglutamate synthase-like GNAT family acetyltransferase
MSTTEFRVRRATVDDLATLKALWEVMRIPGSDLEKRLTEFQIAVDASGKVMGAIGFQILQRHGLVHSEAFSDFGSADQIRPQFWTRIQSLAMNHGVVRLWTRENAPFWTHSGLQPADSETLSRLPETWDRTAPGWFTLRLKDEDVMASLDKEFELFVSSEKQRSAAALSQAQKLRTIITILGLLIALGLGAAAVYAMLTQRVPPSPH